MVALILLSIKRGKKGFGPAKLIEGYPSIHEEEVNNDDGVISWNTFEFAISKQHL